MKRDDFISYLKIDKNYSDNTVESYMRDIRFFLEYVKKEVDVITKKDIDDYILHIIKTYNDSSVKNSALLLVDNFDPSIYQETSMLIDLLERGQTIIIFTNEEFNESLERQLGINLSSDRYYTYSNSTNKSDSIICEWQGDSCYDDARYIFRLLDYEMSYLVPDYNDVRSVTDDYDYGYDNYGYEYEDDDYRYEDDDYGYEDDEYGYESVSSPYEYEDEYDPKRLNFEWTELMLTSDNYNECVVAVGNCDKGKLVLVSMPWLFSNYYVLEDGGAQLLMRILSQVVKAL